MGTKIQGWRRLRAPIAAAGAITIAFAVLPGGAWAATSETATTSAPQLVRAVQANGPLMSYAINTAATRAAVRDAETAVNAAGGTVKVSYPQIGVLIAHSTDTEFLANIKALDPDIQSAGPTRTAAFTEPAPGNPFVPAPPATTTANGVYGADMTVIGVDQAHQVTKGSSSVIVGVLDDGVDDTHSALKPTFDAADSVSCINNGGKVDTTPNSWRPWVSSKNVTDSHGTHVAGAIAANDIGQNMIGIAPNTRIASVKVVNPDGFIYPEYAICGFVWAAEHGFSVTNNSYNVDPWFFWCPDQANQAPAMEAVKRAVDYSARRGVLNVAAAGNDNYDLANLKTESNSPNDTTATKNRPVVGCLDVPGQLPGVVNVSATTNTKAKASFSSYGLGVINVAAPGSSTRSTVPGGGYGNKSGTSMASPHVAGVAALLKATHPQATPAQLTQMLHAQAEALACPSTATTCQAPAGKDRLIPGYNGYFGYGLVNAYQAVTAAYDPGPGSGFEVITADIKGAPLALTVPAGSTITLPQTTLTGFDLVISGTLHPVTVVDPRGTSAGWNLVGQASDLVGPNGLIVADNVGWNPTAQVVSGTLPAAPGEATEVTAGAPAVPGSGTGLANARNLCSSAAGVSGGAFTCGGDLKLGIPGSTRVGTYTGVLTLTLI